MAQDLVFGRPLYVMAKPAGASCNLRCKYCYYLEKSQAIAAAAKEPEKPAKAAAKPAETAESDLSGKDRRRERAKQRAGISGIRRKLENAVADAEKKLADLEARQQELVAQMSGDDKVDFAQLNREMTEVQNAMEETMKAWEDAAWELERFLKDNAQ